MRFISATTENIVRNMQTFTRIFGQAYSALLCEIRPHVAYLAIRHEMLPLQKNTLIAAGTRAARAAPEPPASRPRAARDHQRAPRQPPGPSSPAGPESWSPGRMSVAGC